MKEIRAENAPEAIWPYCHAIVGNGFLIGSGQIAINPKTKMIVPNDIEKQTLPVLKNIEAVLLEAGLGLKNIVKTIVYLTDMVNFQGMNKIYASIFADHRPARAIVAVVDNPLNALIQVDYIAMIDAG